MILLMICERQLTMLSFTEKLWGRGNAQDNHDRDLHFGAGNVCPGTEQWQDRRSGRATDLRRNTGGFGSGVIWCFPTPRRGEAD